MPEPWKLLRVPPTTLMSPMLKSVLGLLSWKVRLAVSPALSVVLLLLTMMVGVTVSLVSETVLLASAPSVLKLPAASLNLVEATLMVPLVLVPGVGVKVAL